MCVYARHKARGECVYLCVCVKEAEQITMQGRICQAEEHVCGPVLGWERHANLDQNVA